MLEEGLSKIRVISVHLLDALCSDVKLVSSWARQDLQLQHKRHLILLPQALPGWA